MKIDKKESNKEKITKSIKKSKSKPKDKIFYTSVENLEQKKEKILKKLEGLTGSENKKKRSNWYKVNQIHLKKKYLFFF